MADARPTPPPPGTARQWLEQKLAWLNDVPGGNGLNYYLGPAARPVTALVNAVAAMSPGADMVDMADSSRDLMASKGGWDTVAAIGGLGAATLGMAIPGTAKGITSATDEVAGGLRTVYHGTPNPDVASGKVPLGLGLGQRTDYGNFGTGVYTTPKEFLAKAYAEKGGQRGGVLKLQADLKNPLYVTVAGPEYTDEVERIARDLGVTAKPKWEGSGQKSREFADQFREKAMAAGYDGVITRDIDGAEGAELVVFDPASLRKYGEAPKAGIRAFHGSPHDFDAFSMDKIGTGEGAQAYGHGLYFAESEGVAKSYKEALANRKYMPGDGASPLKTAWSLVSGSAERAAMPTDELVPFVKGAWPNASDDEIRAAIDEAKSAYGPGHMYEVRINANPDDFLDWDKPLSEQSEKVRGVARDKGLSWGETKEAMSDRLVGLGLSRQEADEYATSNFYDSTGAMAYRELGSKDTATAALREAGIPGIRYLDQGSRTAGDGSRNYVVFDDSIVEIMRKYGLLAGVGIGGSALAASGTTQDGVEWSAY